MCGCHKLQKMPRKKKGNSEGAKLPSEAERHRTLKHLQETFAEQIDPDVVYFVLSENEYNVEASLETLLTLSSEHCDQFTARSEEPSYCKSSDDKSSAKFEELTGRKRLNATDNTADTNLCVDARTFSDIIYGDNQQQTSALYCGSHNLYHSNEDLYTENGGLDRVTNDPYIVENQLSATVTHELEESSNTIVNGLCESETRQTGSSDDAITLTENHSPYVNNLKEVLSPQSDCSLEADASESIVSSLDHNVDSTCNISLAVENHSTQKNTDPLSEIDFNIKFPTEPLSVNDYHNALGTWPGFVNIPSDSSYQLWPESEYADMYSPSGKAGAWNWRTPPSASKPRSLNSAEKLLARIQRGEKVLVILRGLPGSGKSTLARKLTKGRGLICSTDNYFIRSCDLKYVFEPTKLPEAHEWNQRIAKKAIENGTSPVVIDNTNTESWEMRPYVLCGARHKYHIEILEPDTSWKFVVHELARKNTHSIPKDKIKNMMERYEHNVTVRSILSNLPENHELHPARPAAPRNRASPRLQFPAVQAPQARRPQPTVVFDSGGNAASGHRPRDYSVQSLTESVERLHMPRVSRNRLQRSAAEPQMWDFSSNGICSLDNPQEGNEGITESYYTEDPDFWQIDGGETRADSEMNKAEVAAEENLTSARTRFRNRQPPGNLKTLEDIIQSSCAKEIGSNSSTVSVANQPLELTNDWSIDDAWKSCGDGSASDVAIANDVDVPHLVDGPDRAKELIGSGEMVEDGNMKSDRKDAITEADTLASKLGVPKKKLAARFDQALLLDDYRTNFNWSIPNFPADECDQVPAIKTVAMCESGENDSKEASSENPNLRNENACDKYIMDQLERFELSCQPISALDADKEAVSVNYKLLKELFPNTKDDSLWDLFKKCDGNVEWVTNLLLDSSHELPASCESVSSVDGKSASSTLSAIDESSALRKTVSNDSISVISTVTGLTSENGIVVTKNDELNASVDESLNAAIEEALNLVGEDISGSSGHTLQISGDSFSSTIIESVMEKSNIADLSSLENSETVGSTVLDAYKQGNDVSQESSLLAGENNSSSDLTHIDELPLEKLLPSTFHNEGITFSLDPALAMQLEEMFGSANFPEDSRSYDKESLDVRIDVNLAWQIYNCWTQSLQDKENAKDYEMNLKLMSNEKNNDGNEVIANGEMSKRAIPKGRSNRRQDHKRSHSCDSSAVEKGVNHQPIVKRDSVPNLKEIMDLEMALAFTKADVLEEVEKKWSDHADLAAKLKRQMLYDKFPYVDKNALNEVFTANNYSLPQTEQEIQTAFGEFFSVPPDPPVSTREGQRSAVSNQAVVRQVTKSAEALLRPKDVDLPPEMAELQDFRAEATLHHKLRQECFSRAQSVYQRGMKAAAMFYAEQGHTHTQKMREANRRASLQILLHQNLGRDNNTIDLHLLFIREALEMLESFLKIKLSELQRSRDRKVVLRVITGRGAHSIGEVPRIKQAVQEYLKRKKFRYYEKSAGLIEVTITKKDCADKI